MALLHVNFFSDVLGMSMNMDVILPQETKGQIGMKGRTREGKIPSLYLLHGMSDDHTIWQRRTSIERYVSQMGIAVIMPCVHLSFYTNMVHGLPYWDYISEELPSLCQNFFPQLSARPEDNFAAGLSMGGYGAWKLALGEPERFGAAASLSGALDMAAEYREERDPAKKRLWADIFGSPQELEGSDNDLLALAARRSREDGALPPLYAWCGQEDFLYAHNCRARDVVRGLGFDLTWEESHGDHLWECWDEMVQRVLAWLPLKERKTDQENRD